MCELLVVGQNQLIQTLAMTEPKIQIFLPSKVTAGLGYSGTKLPCASAVQSVECSCYAYSFKDLPVKRLSN